MTVTDSIYSKSFFSLDLNKVKYDSIEQKANLILTFKNILSRKFNSNPVYYASKSAFDIVTEESIQIIGLVGREIRPAIEDVFDCYKNKFDCFKNRCKAKIQKSITVTNYKKTSKKGQVKDFKINFKSTPLSSVVTYLTKYYNPTLIPYLISEIEKNESEQVEFYKSVLHYINKFGERLIKLCLNRRQMIIDRLFEFPISFKSKAYRAVNNTQIIGKNKNKHSKIEDFISLTGFKDLTETNVLDVPVKFRKDYHGKHSDYNTSKQKGYVIKILENNQVRIIITKTDEREFVEDKEKLIGADVNLKHNLFSCSDSTTIDYDRELINNYFKTLNKFDSKEELTKKQLVRKDKWLKRIDNHFKSKCNELITNSIENGFDHIVIEDLKFNESSHVKLEQFNNNRISRVTKLLRLNNIKNYLSSQCQHKKIQLTIVPSNYTSQRCSCCGYVDKDNRKTQEEFLCLNCGHEDNADSNASKNIKDYKDLNDLSSKLLVQKNGWFIPKLLGKQVVKGILNTHFEQYS